MKDYTGFYELTASSSLSESLGIDDERENELHEILIKYVVPENRVSQSMELIWNACNHPNEFAFCIFHYGNVMGISKVLKGKSVII